MQSCIGACFGCCKFTSPNTSIMIIETVGQYRNNDITDVLELNFTTTEDRFGEIRDVELKPGGGSISVTETNKKEYVDAMVQYRIKTRVEDQFNAFMDGFKELIPLDLITVFDERELEFLVGGVPEIDTCVATRSLQYSD